MTADCCETDRVLAITPKALQPKAQGRRFGAPWVSLRRTLGLRRTWETAGAL